MIDPTDRARATDARPCRRAIRYLESIRCRNYAAPVARPPLYWLDFFVELPFDIRLPAGAIKRGEVDFNDPTLGRIDGWADVTIDPHTGVPDFPEPGVWPSTTISWRRRSRRPARPDRIAWGIFGDEMLSDVALWRRVSISARVQLTRFRSSYGETATVVRLIRVDSPPALPLTSEWVSSQFARGLRHLNEFLVPLSWVSADPRMAPLHPRQLSARIAGFQTDIGARLHGRRSRREPFLLRLDEGNSVSGAGLPSRFVDEALQMAPDPGTTRPFLPILDFLVAGRGALARGLNAQAVIDATTTIELLVNQVIIEIGPQKDPRRYGGHRLQSVLDAPFKSRVVDHYAKLLGATPDLAAEGDEIGRWWNRCYLLRNRVAHEGVRPSDHDAALAVMESERLNDWTGRRIHMVVGFLAAAVPDLNPDE